MFETNFHQPQDSNLLDWKYTDLWKLIKIIKGKGFYLHKLVVFLRQPPAPQAYFSTSMVNMET